MKDSPELYALLAFMSHNRLSLPREIFKDLSSGDIQKIQKWMEAVDKEIETIFGTFITGDRSGFSYTTVLSYSSCVDWTPKMIALRQTFVNRIMLRYTQDYQTCLKLNESVYSHFVETEHAQGIITFAIILPNTITNYQRETCAAMRFIQRAFKSIINDFCRPVDSYENRQKAILSLNDIVSAYFFDERAPNLYDVKCSLITKKCGQMNACFGEMPRAMQTVEITVSPRNNIISGMKELVLQWPLPAINE